MTYLDAIVEAQVEEMERDPRVILMGEDIAVYGSGDLVERFGPFRGGLRSITPTSTGKASSSCSGRFFCRRPLMSRTAYLPFPLFPLRGTVRAFGHRSRLGLSVLRLSALECLNSLADCMIYFALC